MLVPEIAPEIDRLVWAANFAARDHHMGEARALLRQAGMSEGWLVTLSNLVPFLSSGQITEAMIQRRYRYRPAAQLAAFVDESVAAGYLARSRDGLVSTESMLPVMEAMATGLAAACDSLWGGRPDVVDAASESAGAVIAAAAEGFPLFDAHRSVPEPNRSARRLHHRLSGLRLLRNEAHAQAWATQDLSPGDMVALTRLWRGTRAPTDPVDFEVTEGLKRRGLVVDGHLTDEGRTVRQQIEDDTNGLVEPAFQVLGSDGLDRFLSSLRLLPGQP